jgi:hypothetical protein
MIGVLNWTLITVIYRGWLITLSKLMHASKKEKESKMTLHVTNIE